VLMRRLGIRPPGRSGPPAGPPAVAVAGDQTVVVPEQGAHSQETV